MSQIKSAEELTAALIERRLLPANAKSDARPVNARPWYIEVVLGGAGWLAGVFALVFVGLLFRPDSFGAYALCGGVLLAAAFALYKVDAENAFFDQLALAFSMAGQSLLTLSFSDINHSVALAAGLVAIMQVLLLAAMPNRLARLLAALFACIAWALAIRFGWWGEHSFWNERRESIALVPALLGWVLVWVPLILFAWTLVVTETRWLASGWQRIARPGLTGLLIGIAFGTFVSQPIVNFELWGTQHPVRENWLALWPLLSVASSVFVLFAAWTIRSRAMLGAAIAAALLHVMHFYYLLGASLLWKSCIMLIAGAVLVIAAIMQRRAVGTGTPT